MKVGLIKASILMFTMEVLILCASAQCQVTKDTPGWFEFVIPGLDATQTPVDMSFLNPEPAGAAGFTRIEDGHFVDGTGNRLRLLGTNLTFGSAFPDKDAAPKIAAHMRKLGINVVRFHHMDNSPNPRGIWLKDQKGFDPEQLDKLDWIIYQLKQNGIYTNINLHVSRSYPGLPRDMRAFRYGKVLDHFYRPFIEMQKDYARDLLTHKNPYTGTTYIEEPAVMFVEINNENTLIRNWGDLLTMPEPFNNVLLEQWNDWLKKHYSDTAKLRDAWDVAREPLSDELFMNRNFEDGAEHWSLETGTSAEGKLEISDDAGRIPALPDDAGKMPALPDDAGKMPALPGKALHVITTKQGEQVWNLQLHQHNMTLENGAPYTLSFWAKSDEERSVNVGVRLQQEPWRFLGLQKSVKLTTEWSEYSFVFQAQDSEPELTRLDVNFNNQMGHFWFAGMSLRRGGIIGLPEDQSLEAGNVALPPTDSSASVKEDFWNFLFDVEMDYSQEMVKLLKDELKVKGFVSVTQASYGGIAGVYREAELADYVDMHSYWQHPRFPITPWSRRDWDIPNTSMVRDRNGGTLTRLAIHRVNGMPYTVSEYDHPAPNDYSTELFPMLASFAAFQDWDGIYQFSYGGGDWDRRRISGYFSMNGHPGKLAFLPIAAVMLRMNGVSAGAPTIVLNMPTNEIMAQLTLHSTNARAAWEAAGATTSLPVTDPVAVQFRDGDLSLSQAVAEPSGKWVSGTGQIVWDKAESQTALYTVNSPAVRAAVGYLGGRSVTLGDIKIEMPNTETNWASIAIAALDGKPISESDRILLVAAGRIENTNMGWNEDRTSVSDRWGEEPTVAEGIPATITFTKSRNMQVQPLDGTGMPKGDVPCETSDSGMTFTIGAQYKTLWYLLRK